MEFKQWLEVTEDDIIYEVKNFLDSVVTATWQTGKVTKDGVVTFKFPDYVGIANQISATSAFATSKLPLLPDFQKTAIEPTFSIAASRQYNLPSLDEVRQDMPKIHPAFKATISGIDPEKFEKSFTTNLSKIARQMGFMFETQCFLNLVSPQPGPNLKNVGFSSNANVKNEDKRHRENIKNASGNKQPGFLKNVYKLVEQNGINMSIKMHKKTIQLLQQQCRVNSTMYIGGSVGAATITTGDISLGCKDNMIEYSLKFITDSLVKIRHQSTETILTTLGGTKEKNRIMSQLKEKYGDPTSFNFGSQTSAKKYNEGAVRFLVKEIEKLMVPIVTDTRKYADLVNKLIGDVYLAVRRYSKGLSSDIGHGPAIAKDFNIRKNKVYAKQKSTATVRSTGDDISKKTASVVASYKVPGGSKYGTTIIFRLTSPGDSHVFINNLTSER